ncbi:MAG: hypothetical protein D6820_12195, partial [Lentisphaerae bacterium]
LQQLLKQYPSQFLLIFQITMNRDLSEKVIPNNPDLLTHLWPHLAATRLGSEIMVDRMAEMLDIPPGDARLKASWLKPIHNLLAWPKGYWLDFYFLEVLERAIAKKSGILTLFPKDLQEQLTKTERTYLQWLYSLPKKGERRTFIFDDCLKQLPKPFLEELLKEAGLAVTARKPNRVNPHFIRFLRFLAEQHPNLLAQPHKPDIPALICTTFPESEWKKIMRRQLINYPSLYQLDHIFMNRFFRNAPNRKKLRDQFLEVYIDVMRQEPGNFSFFYAEINNTLSDWYRQQRFREVLASIMLPFQIAPDPYLNFSRVFKVIWLAVNSWKKLNIHDEELAKLKAKAQADPPDVASLRFLAAYSCYAIRVGGDREENLRNLERYALKLLHYYPHPVYYNQTLELARISRDEHLIQSILDHFFQHYPGQWQNVIQYFFKELEQEQNLGQLRKFLRELNINYVFPYAMNTIVNIAHKKGLYEEELHLCRQVLQRIQENKQFLHDRKSVDAEAIWNCNLARALAGLKRDEEAVAILNKVIANQKYGTSVRNLAKEVMHELHRTGITENRIIPAHIHGIQAIHITDPKKKPVIDGDLMDWELAHAKLACPNLSYFRASRSARIAFACDDDYLYVAVKWRDITPMNNRARPNASVTQVLRGDCLRLIFPGQRTAIILTAWYYEPRQLAAVEIHKEAIDPAARTNTDSKRYTGKNGELGHRFALAFKPDPNKLGYNQEMRIPWSALREKAPHTGQAIPMLIEFFWDENNRTATRFLTNLPSGANPIETGDWRTAKPNTLQCVSARDLKPVHEEWEVMLNRRQYLIPRKFKLDIDEVRTFFFIDSEHLFCAGKSGRCRIFSLKAGKPVTMTSPAVSSICHAMKPNHNQALVTTKKGEILFFDLKTGKLDRTIRASSRPIWCAAFTPDKRFLATGDISGELRLFDLESAQVHSRVSLPRGLRSLHIPERLPSCLLAGSYDGELIMLSIPQLKIIRRIKAHTYSIRSITTNPDATLLVTAGDEGIIRCWRLPELTPVSTLKGHQSIISGVTFISNNALISASFDGTIRYWPEISKPQPSILYQQENGICAIDLSPDRKLLAFFLMNNELRFIDLEALPKK